MFLAVLPVSEFPGNLYTHTDTIDLSGLEVPGGVKHHSACDENHLEVMRVVFWASFLPIEQVVQVTGSRASLYSQWMNGSIAPNEKLPMLWWDVWELGGCGAGRDLELQMQWWTEETWSSTLCWLHSISDMQGSWHSWHSLPDCGFIVWIHHKFSGDVLSQSDVK